MPALPVKFHPAASEEYEGAYRWYFARRPEAAEAFAESIRVAIAAIGEAPDRWPLLKRDIRKYVVQGFNRKFIIYYRVFPAYVKLYSVGDGRRRPGYWRRRLRDGL